MTVHQKKKTSRALVRARRVKKASMEAVLGREGWTGYESSMRQGLRELDETAETKRRGTYASKPLLSRSLAGDDDDEDENRNNGQLSEREAWAEKVEGIWNDVLEADSRAGKPRITLPGFPIQVVKVKIARDFGHHKIFWDLAEGDTPPPESLLRQLHQARSKGFNARVVLLKTTAERLKRHEGYLRAGLAKRLPMRRVPEVRWQHVSEMSTAMRLEL